MKTRWFVLLLGIGCLMAGAAYAQDDSLQGKKGEIPPMGVPQELKQMAFLIGTWDYDMKMKMDPASDSMTEIKGSAAYSYILDSAAIQSVNDGPEFGGMKFQGFSLTTYDREKKVWQMTWTDNMAARTSIYEGTHAGDVTTVTGEDRMGGQVWLTRMTSFNEKPTSFDWKMEMSADGGKTWGVGATAHYTKR